MTNLGNFAQSNIREGVYPAIASGTLTDKEGYLVKFTGSMSGKYPIVALLTAGTDAAIGVLESGAASGGNVEVRPFTVESTFRVVAASSITVGQLVTATSAGKVQPANAGDTIIGRAEESVTVAADTPLVLVRGPVSGNYTTTNNWWEGTSVTLTDTASAFTFILGTTNGTKIGGAAAQKLGFYNTTPVVQPSSANQTAVTDNSGGSVADAVAAAVTANAATTDNSTGAAGNTVAAGAGCSTIVFPIALAGVTNGDVLTTYTPGYKFKILTVDFAVTTVVSTPAKATTLNIEIDTTNLSGGVVALTSANCTPLGAVIAGTAVTGNNTGSASATLSIEASATTQFAEGQGVLLVKIQNMDTADAVASFADKLNTIRTALTTLNDNFAKGVELTNAIRTGIVSQGLIKGSA
jgi:hypothetical protein